MTQLLANRNAIITGGNQGLGLEIAKHYIAAGANVLICARDEGRLETSLRELRERAAPTQVILTKQCDVAKSEDVKGVVAAALKELKRIDVLVNNAGVVGPTGPSEEVDWNEWVRALEINLLGTVLMCRELVPHFKKNRSGKIIQISGGGATNPIPMMSAYAASKAAVIRYAETLAGELREFAIDVNAIAPGLLKTRMLDEMLAGGPERIGADFYRRLQKEGDAGGTPLARGAELAVFLGSKLSDGITGKIISAVWDPWPVLPDHLDDLRSSDVYTLRRIVPKDRDMKWGGEN